MIILNLRGSGFVQETLGSPMYPDGQVQTGSWFSTLQKALVAQGSVTAQGLRHFLLMQALCRGHSELSRHSGARTGTRSGGTETCEVRSDQSEVLYTYFCCTGPEGCLRTRWGRSS